MQMHLNEDGEAFLISSLFIVTVTDLSIFDSFTDDEIPRDSYVIRLLCIREKNDSQERDDSNRDKQRRRLTDNICIQNISNKEKVVVVFYVNGLSHPTVY